MTPACPLSHSPRLTCWPTTALRMESTTAQRGTAMDLRRAITSGMLACTACKEGRGHPRLEVDAFVPTEQDFRPNHRTAW